MQCSQRGFPLLPECLGGGSYVTGSPLLALTMAIEKAEETRLLADVTQCGRGQKWGYRGRSTPGFKPRHGSHAGAYPWSLGAERELSLSLFLATFSLSHTRALDHVGRRVGGSLSLLLTLDHVAWEGAASWLCNSSTGALATWFERMKKDFMTHHEDAVLD